MAISNTSGLAGIAVWLSANLFHGQSIPKDDSRVVQLKDWVDQQYAGGRTTAIGPEELVAACRNLHILQEDDTK